MYETFLYKSFYTVVDLFFFLFFFFHSQYGFQTQLCSLNHIKMFH